MFARAFPSILICVSLALGALAAVTAYLPRLTAVRAAAESGEVLTLGAPSGRIDSPNGTVGPMAVAGDPLTPELIDGLASAGVVRVRVREFAFARWSHGWLFGAAVAGMLAWAAIVRRRRGRELAAHQDKPAGDGASPEAAIEALHRVLAALAREASQLRASAEGRGRFVNELTELQGVQVEGFLAARDALIARHGLGGAAALMSRFAVMERRVNRAWSAASRAC